MRQPAGLRSATLTLYAMPAVALGLPTIPVFGYLPTFYADSLGVGLALTGSIIFLIRLFDVVTDPLVGLFSDWIPGRFGKRRLPILLGAPLAGLGLLRLFDPPAEVGAGYLLIWGLVLYGGWTLIAVPYAAWGAELSRDYHMRARITAAREAAMLGGVVLAASLPALLSLAGYSERQALESIGWLAIAWGAPSLLLLLTKVPDTASSDYSPSAGRAVGLWRALRELAGNRPFLRLMGAWLVNGLANGIPAVLFLLYMEFVLGADETTRGALILAYFLCGIMAVPLWLRLSRRFGKHRTWGIAMVLACCAFATVPLLGEGDIVAFLVICIVTGMALGADLTLPPAVQADVVDYDKLRFGADRTALLFSLWNLATKISLAGAVAIAFPLLQAMGFDPQASAAITPGASLGLALIYAGLPVVLKLFVVVLIWGFPLTATRQSMIRRRLERRTVKA